MPDDAHAPERIRVALEFLSKKVARGALRCPGGYLERIVANVRDELTRLEDDSSTFTPTLMRLRDPEFLMGIVTVRVQSRLGLSYLLPVIIAWLVLGYTEWRYSQAGTDEAFFAWWSAQNPLGPHVYSLSIALFLFVIFLGQTTVGRYSRRREEENEADLQRIATSTALDVDIVLMEHGRRDDNLAAQRFESASTALRDVVGELRSNGSAVGDFRGGLEDLRLGVETMGTTVSDLGHAVMNLDGAMDRIERLTQSLPDILNGGVQMRVDVDHAFEQFVGRLDRLALRLDEVQTEISSITTALHPAVGTASEVVGLLPRAEQISTTLKDVLVESTRLHGALTALEQSSMDAVKQEMARLHSSMNELIREINLGIALKDSPFGSPLGHNDGVGLAAR